MLLGKVAAPTAESCKFWPPFYEQALDNTLTIITSQPGYFWSDGLMAMLNERDRHACWLRLEPEDQDPAGLLLSLIAAARRIEPEIGAQTLAAMRASPGPVAGWEPLYAQLGEEFMAQLPGNCVLVLEHVHQLAHAGPAVALLLSSFLPWVTRRFPCLLTSQKLLSLESLPGTAVEYHLEDLRLEGFHARSLFKQAGCPLTEDCIQAAVRTNNGRAVALAGLCSASEILDQQTVEHAIFDSSSPEQLFTRVAQSILTKASPDAPEALAIANQLTYIHPAMISASLGTNPPLTGPWMQPLSDGWERVHQIWIPCLQSMLHIPAEALQEALLHAADFLFSQGAVVWAVRIYFHCGAMESAARAIAGIADSYLDLGLWETLEGWLEKIPFSIQEEWPRLVYIQGEIQAFNGESDKARAAFVSASQLFANRLDMDGYCQSKLAESALALQHHDHDHAWSSALAASTHAAQMGLRHQGDWANWQLGRLAAAADKLEDALGFFTQGSPEKQDPVFSQLFDQAAGMARELQEEKRKRESHRLAYLELEKAEQATIQQLNDLLNAPLPQAKEGLAGQGWSQIHPVLKFSSLPPENLRQNGDQLPLWLKIAQSLGLKRPARVGRKPKVTLEASQGQLILPLFQSELFLPQASRDSTPKNHPLLPQGLAVNDPQHEEKGSPEDPVPMIPVLTQETGSEIQTTRMTAPSLAVHCLGPFQVFLNDRLIENWPLRKALASFKYLLVHRRKFVSKEILMETFWPEADPEAARRNLHQAVYSLRQSLHLETPDYQSIVFVNDRYRLNPELEIWSDDEDFEHYYESGSQLEKDHQVEQAIQEYEIAINLYRGDFMAEDLYEDWPTSRRDYLRQINLTMIYRLAEFYYSKKEYSIAASFCQRIIYMDDCQEEAHLNLMKCYLAQGKRYPAVQQYYLCRQALKVKLNLSPSPEMQELYRQVMKR